MDKLPTDFSTQTVSTDFSKQTPSRIGVTPQIGQTESSYVRRNQIFISELNETILSSNELLKKDISKHKKKINLNKIKKTKKIIFFYELVRTNSFENLKGYLEEGY